MDKKFTYVLLGLVAIAAVAIAFVFFGQNKPAAVQETQQPPSQAVAQQQQGAPAIVKAVMSRSIDAKGNATGVTTTFNAKTDKVVYAILSLQNPTKNTKLSYVRYLNGKYVDSKVALPSKDNMTTFYFSFEKGVGDYPKGTYTLKLYVNGNYSQTLTYIFN